MPRIEFLSAGMAICLAYVPTISAKAATTITAQQENALEAITTTADRICNVVITEGSAHSKAVKGEVNAELNGLAKKLANLGVSGGGAVTSADYQGVLQADLAAALRDNSACKTNVFNKLQDKLLPTTKSLATDAASSESESPTQSVFGNYTGPAKSQITNVDGTMSLNIASSSDTGYVDINTLIWGCLNGEGTLRGQITPKGHLRAPGEMKASFPSGSFDCNLEGDIVQDRLKGHYTVYPRPGTRAGIGVTSFDLQRFVALVTPDAKGARRP